MEKKLENRLDWQEIGQRFRDLRERHNLTQSKIGEIASQLRQSVTRFEAGVQPASTNYALFLRNEFEASFDWLYDGVEAKIKSSDRLKKRIINPIEIGERIKKVRKEEGMTLKEFGEWIGISYVAVSNIENGHRTPEIKTALKIKRALGKPLDWIYFGDEPIVPKKNRLRSNQIKSNQINLRQNPRESQGCSRCFTQLFTTIWCVWWGRALCKTNNKEKRS
ncbi:MAG: helix-turn-helix domain-containing protein [Candidatus Liberibacter psyllaurous]